MRLERVPVEAGAILYVPARLDHPSDADFDPERLRAEGRIVGTAQGRGSVWFLSAPGDTVPRFVLRHYRRGGLIARMVTDRYLWRGEAATRAFREFHLLSRLEELGLPAVRAVAARYRRSGPVYRADLLTVAVPGACSLASRLAAGLAAADWQRVGATIRAFHDAGVRHADLNAHNVLFDGRGDVHLVDFDRGAIVPPGAWREANLARLKRSLVKLGAFGAGEHAAPVWFELRAGYDAPRSAPPR